MEKSTNQKPSHSIRPSRYFSEEFKRKKVREIEQNLSSVTQISRTYCVSRSAVYKWIYKYSLHLKKGIQQVIEMKSDTKKIELLEEKIKELERVIGQKQLMVDFHEKMLEFASKEVGYDIKKKHGSQLSPGTGKTGKNTGKK